MNQPSIRDLLVVGAIVSVLALALLCAVPSVSLNSKLLMLFLADASVCAAAVIFVEPPTRWYGLSLFLLIGVNAPLRNRNGLGHF